MSVKVWEVWAWAVKWLWTLVSQLLWACSVKQNGSSSAALPQQPVSGGHLPSLRLKSSSCVTSSSCAPWAAAAGVTFATGRKYTHLSAWMSKVMVLSCVEMLPSKVGLNFHPQYFHIAVKGGLYNDVAGCSASIHCLHERSPLQSHISSGEEQLLWEVFFVLFLTGGHRLLQKIFKYILLEISAPLVHRCECTYGTSGTIWCTGHAIKVIFALLPENTANLKISIMYWEVLRVKLSITSLKSQDWALYFEFFSSDFYLLGAE